MFLLPAFDLPGAFAELAAAAARAWDRAGATVHGVLGERVGLGWLGALGDLGDLGDLGEWIAIGGEFGALRAGSAALALNALALWLLVGLVCGGWRWTLQTVAFLRTGLLDKMMALALLGGTLVVTVGVEVLTDTLSVPEALLGVLQIVVYVWYATGVVVALWWWVQTNVRFLVHNVVLVVKWALFLTALLALTLLVVAKAKQMAGAAADPGGGVAGAAGVSLLDGLGEWQRPSVW